MLLELMHMNGTETDITEGFHSSELYRRFIQDLLEKTRRAHNAGWTILYRPNLHIEQDKTPIVITDAAANDQRIKDLSRRLPFINSIIDILLMVISDSPSGNYVDRLRIHDSILREHRRILFGGKYTSGCVTVTAFGC